MPVLADPKRQTRKTRGAYDGWDVYFERPAMEVIARDRLPGPIGFIDFDRLRAKAENGRNVTERRCQIRSVKYK